MIASGLGCEASPDPFPFAGRASLSQSKPRCAADARTLHYIFCRVLLIVDGESEVSVSRPALRQRRRVRDIKVHRELLHVVPPREQQNAPV